MQQFIHRLRLVVPLMLFASFAFAQVPTFDVYSFQFDPSLRIGYPRGWTVREDVDPNQTFLSAAITKSDAEDTEGFIVYFIPFPVNTEIKNSKQFADITINNLRLEALPGLKLVRDYPHTELPLVHVSELNLDLDNTRFSGKSWSAFMTGEGFVLGLFALFYGPESTFGNYNSDEMLASLHAPVFGTMTAQTPSAQETGGLDSRFFGTWALHTTVADNTMMQENTYNPDGTFVIRQYASGSMMSISPYGRASASQSLHGTWRVQDGVFYLRWQSDGTVSTYRFTFMGDNFIEMQGINVRENLKFRRVVD